MKKYQDPDTFMQQLHDTAEKHNFNFSLSDIKEES